MSNREPPEIADLIIEKINAWREEALRNYAKELGLFDILNGCSSAGIPTEEVAEGLKDVIKHLYGPNAELRWKISKIHTMVKNLVHEEFLAVVNERHTYHAPLRVSKILRILCDPDCVVSSKYFN